MKKLTLIGGAPLAGKTTLSKHMAAKDSAVELSTDTIRSWMQKVSSPEQFPDLHFVENHDVDEFYRTHTTPQSVVDSEVREGKEVEIGIVALIQSNLSWLHLIIEGIALSPEFMKRVEKIFPEIEIEQIILADTDIERITKRITERGLWGKKGSYPEKYIPIEAEWVILYNEWFIEQAKSYGIEVSYN